MLRAGCRSLQALNSLPRARLAAPSSWTGAAQPGVLHRLVRVDHDVHPAALVGDLQVVVHHPLAVSGARRAG